MIRLGSDPGVRIILKAPWAVVVCPWACEHLLCHVNAVLFLHYVISEKKPLPLKNNNRGRGQAIRSHWGGENGDICNTFNNKYFYNNIFFAPWFWLDIEKGYQMLSKFFLCVYKFSISNVARNDDD